MDIFKETERTSVSFKFQMLLITIGMSIFITLIFWRSHKVITRETPPVIYPITPALYKELGGFAKNIQAGLYIDQFINFDVVSNNFMFDGIVWFTFDPGAIALDTLEKFSFLKGEIISKSSASIKLIDQKLNVQYQIRVKFSSALNYADFPLDDHKVYLVLANQFISPSEIIFESFQRQFIVNADISTSGWQLFDQAVQTGYLESHLNPDEPRQEIKYPAILFTMDYVHRSIRYPLSIVLPLALICYLMFFTISMRLLSALTITAAGVTAILAYRFVIENLSPKTGFFMISDYIFFLFLAVTVLIFLVHAGETIFAIKPFYKKIYLYIMHIGIIAITIYILIR